MKAAIYCRVSTEEQAAEGHSIEAQRLELIQYCKAFNYEIYDYYIDGGYSAATIERPALQRLLCDVANFDIALVWRLDRISRDMGDLMKILDVFSNHQIIFQSKTESFDTSTPGGKLMLNMLGSFAEFERASISERIKMAHKKILNEGKWRGGQPPLGYRINKDKILEIHEEEAQIIRKIFDLSANKNMGTRSIALELNRLGYCNRNNKPLTSAYISRVLKNPTYYGEMIHGRQKTVKKEGKKQVLYRDDFDTYTGLFKPIISKETFHISQENMKKRKLNRGSSAMISNPLGGLIYCGDCKEYMIRNSRKNGEHFFTCSSYKDYGCCTHHYISENILLKEINNIIRNILISEKESLEFYYGLYEEMKMRKLEIVREIKNIEGLLARYSSRKDKLFELMEKEIITVEEFVHRKQKLSVEKLEKQHLLKELKIHLKNIENQNHIQHIEPLHYEFHKLSTANQKKILHGMIQRIEVFKNERPYGKKKIHIYFKI